MVKAQITPEFIIPNFLRSSNFPLNPQSLGCVLQITRIIESNMKKLLGLPDILYQTLLEIIACLTSRREAWVLERLCAVEAKKSSSVKRPDAMLMNGTPVRIRSDNGPEMMARIFR